MGNEYECYLSPELFKALSHRTRQMTFIEKDKSDIFSLGITCLEMAVLQNIQDLYDFDTFTIDIILLNKYLEYLKNNYSKSIYSLIT